MRVKGNISSIEVTNSFQDADIDFSDLSIDSIKINDSGNDCIDFSSGNYFVSKSLIGCADKGISIGERSEAHFESVLLQCKCCFSF